MALPWEEGVLTEWSIAGMNHYHVKGVRHLFVSMVKGDRCIKAEGTDVLHVFVELERLATASDARNTTMESIVGVIHNIVDSDDPSATARDSTNYFRRVLSELGVKVRERLGAF